MAIVLSLAKETFIIQIIYFNLKLKKILYLALKTEIILLLIRNYYSGQIFGLY